MDLLTALRTAGRHPQAKPGEHQTWDQVRYCAWRVTYTEFDICREAGQATVEAARAASSMLEASYDSDFALWLDQQVAMLRAQRFDGLDMVHLIEELDSIGKSDRPSGRQPESSGSC